MQFQDYYETLGVARGASQDEIRSAYRKLALKWHPDRHKEGDREAAEKTFKRLSEANEVLSDPEKRARYDRLGENWQHGQDFTPPGGAGAASGGRQMSQQEMEEMFGGAGGFSDFFRSVFGEQFRQDVGGKGGRHARYQARGADVRADLSLSVGALRGGGKRDFVVPARIACPRCGGVGFLDQHVCPACVGVGQVRQSKSVSLTIPEDARAGQTLRLRGLGEPGESGGEAGDLYLTFRVESDETFRVDGADVEADVPVAPWEALSGCKVLVQTARSQVEVTIPAGTNAGARLRLRGQGLANGRGGHGDFFVVVRMALPDQLNDEQRTLLEQAGTAGSEKVVGGARS